MPRSTGSAQAIRASVSGARPPLRPRPLAASVSGARLRRRGARAAQRRRRRSGRLRRAGSKSSSESNRARSLASLIAPRNGGCARSYSASAASKASRVEVRPQLLAEDELRVGALPEQEVRDPLLAAGADQEVGLVHLGRVEVAAELLLAAPLEALAPRRRSPPARRS